MWDMSLPGYKYLGPGNQINKGEPTNYNDAVAYIHDLGYGELIQNGKNPYIHFSDADEAALQNFDFSSYGGILGKGYFGLKKALYKTGALGEMVKAGEKWKTTKTGHRAMDIIADDKRRKTEWGSLRGTTSEGERDSERKVHRTIDFGDPGEVQEVEMDAKGDVVMSETSALRGVSADVSMGGEGQNGTGETPVNLNTRYELGVFTETRTVILPIRFGVSFNILDNNGMDGNVLKIRLNSPYNILRDTNFVNQTAGSTTVTGTSTNQASAGLTNGSSLYPFETTLIPSTAPTSTTSGSGVVAHANATPGWLQWYEKMYESYHTIETQYRLTYVNPDAAIGRRSVVYEDHDVYTASSTGNIMPVDAYTLYMNSVWKGVKRTIIAERNNSTNEPWIKQMSGTWKPGVWSKNTINSEEVKAWYPTGAEPTPQWVENLVIGACTDEHNTANSNLNVFVELRYIVQFKDLKQSFRYPIHTASTIALNTPGDVIQTPRTPFSGWSTI